MNKEEVAQYIIDNRATTRQAAVHFHSSRAAISRLLKTVEPPLLDKVNEVLQDNLKNRSHRGGKNRWKQQSPP